MSHTPPDPSAQAYLLLTLDNVRVTQVHAGRETDVASGELVLECISLPINPAIGKQQANPFADALDRSKDLWLVIKVGTFELPLLPNHKISKVSSGPTTVFSIPSGGTSVQLYLPVAASQEDKEDQETLEILLKQYGCLPSSQVSREIKGSAAIVGGGWGVGKAPPQYGSSAPGSGTTTPTLRRRTTDGGRFVLVDEDTGQVIGELDNKLDVEVGQGVDAGPVPAGQAGDHKQNQPVVVDFGVLDEGWAQKVSVQTIEERDMDDWMLKGAHYISKGLLMFGNTASKSMTSAAELYIRNTKPREEPVKFSPSTKEGIRQVHNVSAKTVKVTKKTLDTVNNAIGRVVEKAADSGYGGYDKAQTMWKTNYTDRFGGSISSVNTMNPAPPSYTEKPGNLRLETKTPVGPGQAQPATAPALPQRPGAPVPAGTQSQPQSASSAQRPFWNRVFLAAEVIGTSLEATTQTLISSGTNAAAEAAGHKYGAEAGEATRILGGSVRNVALVYVDVRGVGRKTLFKSTAKGFKGVVKTRLADGKEVTITGQDENGNLKIADGDHAARDVTVALQGVGLEEKVTPPQAQGYQAAPLGNVDPRTKKKNM
ncbi:hypothetical protein NCC49_002192 [Naganishia albida]|nr:hypothetical protein NCC49_002192 [Naganishia albida]